MSRVRVLLRFRGTYSPVLLILLPILAVFMIDNIVGYMFPIVVQETVSSNTLMGLIMASSSFVGLLVDFFFAQLFRNSKWYQQLIWGMVLATLFPVFTLLGREGMSVFLFLIASLIWGVYFELLGFGMQGYIVAEDKKRDYSQDWGIIFFIIEIARISGPIIASILLLQRITVSLPIACGFGILAIVTTLLLLRQPDQKLVPVEVKNVHAKFSFKEEVKIWRLLGQFTYPVLLVGICSELVEATFWTIGGIFGLSIPELAGKDWLILMMFEIPLIIGALILARLNVKSGKKHLSQIFLLVGGLLLSLVALFGRQNILALFSLLFLSSSCIAFVGPLNEAVYSDLLARVEKDPLHLLGMVKSTSSLAYIVGPIFMGIFADATDYYSTFAVIGVFCAICAAILLLITPRKIRLPQKQLASLDNEYNAVIA